MKSEEISVTEEQVPETAQFDENEERVERIKKASSAYRMESSVDGVRSGPTKIVPSKAKWESSVELTVDSTGLSKVITSKDVNRGDLLEECYYYVLESRRDDFIASLRDKVAAYLFWCLPEDENVYKSDEVGNHVIIPLGNAFAYNSSSTPNAYFQFDSKMRVLRFYALKDIKSGENVTIGYPNNGIGPSGMSPEKYKDLTGDVIKHKMEQPKKSGGCSACQKKKEEIERVIAEKQLTEKKFRSRIVEEGV